ncbi:MAG: hypothetical protein P8J50_11160 [Acidimicrobiales bacterium]|nr:hypothetical protein [Acidimicrobiales bacterium]
MSETVIFVVGAVIFAITIAGAVMAGGFAFTRIEVEQNPVLEDRLGDDTPTKRFPFRTDS